MRECARSVDKGALSSAVLRAPRAGPGVRVSWYGPTTGRPAAFSSGHGPGERRDVVSRVALICISLLISDYYMHVGHVSSLKKCVLRPFAHFLIHHSCGIQLCVFLRYFGY